jgi:NADPH-dependent 2,4-dienoyl-CoA reductase/sulfur reductase-like enzyme
LGRAGVLLVVGCGFIGLEVAAAASRRGWKVSIAESSPTPLQRVLPGDVASACVAGYTAADIAIRTRTTVTSLLGNPAVRAAKLSNGDVIEVDAVVLGLGALPNIEWLDGSGLEIEGGIRCGSDGHTNRPGVWAAGDVAAWRNGTTRKTMRVEQWQAAREQGYTVADAMLGDRVSWDSPPYFWSDLLTTKLQFSGHFEAGMRTHSVRSGRKLVAVIGDRQVAAVATLGSPRWHAFGQRHVASRAPFDEVCRWADECGDEAA